MGNTIEAMRKISSSISTTTVEKGAVTGTPEAISDDSNASIQTGKSSQQVQYSSNELIHKVKKMQQIVEAIIQELRAV
ncbi:MAG: hypothetical protein V7776_22925 [Halopseudomonas aestusnigri]